MRPSDVERQGAQADASGAAASSHARPASVVIANSRRLAVRQCILICLANSWVPSADSVWRLVRLREAYLRGERREYAIGSEELARLMFARWLYRHDRISDLFPSSRLHRWP